MNKVEIEVFYDGDCPLCLREVRMLMRMDKDRGRIAFTDIAAPGFDAAQLGLTQDELMKTIRGRLADGTLIEGVEVFRRLYSAVGMGPLVAVTRVPGISHALGAAYELFAKNRLRLTGRCDKDGCAIPARSRA